MHYLNIFSPGWFIFSEAIVKDRPETDWDDIVGLGDVKKELRELSKEPGKYYKGILVFGVSLIYFTSDSLMRNLTNSEDPDKMPYNLAFDQGLHCLYIQMIFRERMQFYLKIITCDPYSYI